MTEAAICLGTLELCSSVAQVGPGPVAGWRHGWPLGAGCCCPGQGAREHRLVSPPATATITIQHTYRLSELCSSVVCSLVSSQARCSLVLYSYRALQQGSRLAGCWVPPRPRPRWPARQRGAAARHLCRRASWLQHPIAAEMLRPPSIQPPPARPSSNEMNSSCYLEQTRSAPVAPPATRHRL